jgi:putative hydrolase of the HAD superfamily
MKERLDAVLFDMGYTLLAPHPSFEQLVIDAAAKHGVELTVDQVRQAEGPAWQETSALVEDRRFTLSSHNSVAFWRTFYDRMLRRAGVASPPPGLTEAFYETFTSQGSYAFYDDVFPVLERLREQGIRLGVISNWEAWLHDLLGARGVREEFECIVVSATVGVEKPDRAIFEVAFREMGVRPEHCMYVGDSVEFDVLPSLELGMLPVLIDRRGKHLGEELPCRRITSLYELLTPGGGA